MAVGGSLKLYAEMMRSLDDGVARVMNAVKAAGIENRTLVIFTSDKGGERFSWNGLSLVRRVNCWKAAFAYLRLFAGPASFQQIE